MLKNILKTIVKAIYPLVKAERRFVKRVKGRFSKPKSQKSYSTGSKTGVYAKGSSEAAVKGRASLPGKHYGTVRRGRKAGTLHAIISHVSPGVLIAACAFIVIVVTLIVVLATGGKGDKTALAGAESPGVTESVVMTPTPLPTTTPPPDPVTTTLKQGMSDPVVAEIQQRLMDLNYMDEAEPTQLFGPATKQGVSLFQREENVTVDGCVGPDTYALLMSPDAPEYAVSLGDKGTDVKELKKRLYELGYLSAASSTFDKNTETAVKKFQQRNGLTADGKIGQNTIEKLYGDDVKPNVFSSGEKSSTVLACQKRLQKLGYLTTTPDGTYGKDTINAVKRFQDINGIIADGYLGPQTIKLLNSKSAKGNALILGMSGNDVTVIQQRLVKLKYLSKATGYYGSGTVKAVKSFQKQNKLSTDGKVGSLTRKTLMSSKAKAAPKNSGGSSGGGKGGDSDDDDDKSSVDKFISVAKSKLGCRYVRGAKGPNSFDCSGFVYWCLNHAGVTQSYMTSATWQNCTKYQRIEGMGNLKRGDVISFKGHVGIYMGGGDMINALPDNGVYISKNIMHSSYWTSHFVCGFRIF